MAAALLSQFKHGSFHLPLNLFSWFAALLLLAAGAFAQEPAPRYLVEIELHTEAELLSALRRSEQLLDEGILGVNSAHPVRFLLHGPEVRMLLLQNYARHKEVVDLAARLSAFGVVNIQVCETWMGGQRISKSELPPFIDTIPYAPAEERRLMREENYVYF